MMDDGEFLARVAAYRADGWRLSLINATAVLPGEGLEEGAVDISWSFAKDRAFEHLRERVVPGEEVPSISGSYPPAFLYENEIRELFGVNVTGIDVDLRGQLYKTSQRVPFAPSAIRARLEASGRLEHGTKAAPVGKPAAGEAAAIDKPTVTTPKPAPVAVTEPAPARAAEAVDAPETRA